MQKKHTFNAELKLHKPGNPIQPVINNMNAPSYKIDKHLLNKLNGCLNLSNNYNVKNFISLDEDLTKLKIDENHKMLTYDLKDLYLNILKKETQSQNHFS